MNIHIATVGEATQPILLGIRGFDAADKVYLLPSEKFRENGEKLGEKLEEFGYAVEIVTVDAFDMNDIVSTITDIADQNRSDNLFVNITGGTKLMAGAATSSAYLIGATPYYVLEPEKETPIEERVIELPSTGPKYMDLTSARIKILEAVNRMQQEESKVTVEDLKHELDSSSQRISYHIQQSEKDGLVETEAQGREKKINLTKSGELQLKWSGRND